MVQGLPAKSSKHASIGRRYQSSPIVEAICEFRFKETSSWDLTIPGLVYEKVRDLFPKRRRRPQQFELDLESGPGGAQQRFFVAARTQFLQEDEKALIQVDHDLISVSRLAPYSSWGEFLPLIHKAFNAYKEVANPGGIRRIGLRYINRIEISQERINLEDYFEFRPFVGSKLPQTQGPFLLAIEIPYENDRDRLKLQISNGMPERPNMYPIILDLDYSLAMPEKVTLESVFNWVENAHTHIEQSFEASITERARDMFGRIGE